MNKQQIISDLKEKSQELARLADRLAKTPQMKEKGHLVSRTVRGKLRLYEREGDSDRYIRPDDVDRISRLASKGYAVQLDKAAKLEKSQLDLCIKLLESKKDKAGNDLADTDTVFSQLPDYMRQYTNPDAITDDGYAQAWQNNNDYGKRWTKKDDKLYETPRGEKVRSKSEWIIASMLAEAGVPYRYEEIVALNTDVRVFMHPDFTVLNKRTRKVYLWEHFGRMDDPNYVNNTFMPKMSEYYNFNFLPGDNLLMTFESGAHPLDTTEVKRLIEKYLL